MKKPKISIKGATQFLLFLLFPQKIFLGYLLDSQGIKYFSFLFSFFLSHFLYFVVYIYAGIIPERKGDDMQLNQSLSLQPNQVRVGPKEDPCSAITAQGYKLQGNLRLRDATPQGDWIWSAPAIRLEDGALVEIVACRGVID